MSSEIIPFGKYKGKPLEVLANDKPYMDWLVAQNWFRDRFQSIYTVVINNFQEPTETPEHNAMQGDFINDEFCIKFYSVAFPLEVKEKAERQKKETLPSRTTICYIVAGEPLLPYVWEKQFEKSGIDVCYQLAIEYDHVKEAWNEWTKEFVRITDDLDPTYYSRELKIEIKPTISDNYPAVLRQIQTLGANCLYLKQYTGQGVSEEIFKKIFEQQGIKVVYEHEVKP